MNFYISIAINLCINLVGILSIYLITGMTGLFSLGQASFMAIGAYVGGLLAKNFGLPFFAVAIAAMVAGALFGLLIGLPTIRLRRDYIALVTFGFGEAVVAVLNNFSSVTGGAAGLMGIPKRVNFPIAFGSLVVLTFLVWNFKRSRFGRQCLALKTDELAARTMGIDVSRIKLMTFVLASMITAYAGVLYGFYTTYVDPSIFTLFKSAEWIIVVFFGGFSSLTGTLVSGVVLGALPEVLRNFAQWRIVLYCVIVIVTINFRPKGLFGAYELNLKRLPSDLARLFGGNKKQASKRPEV